MILRRSLLPGLLALSLAPCPTLAQADSDPNRLAGIVTHLASPTAFAVSGTPVELGPSATFATLVGHTSTLLAQPPALFLGEAVQLTGSPRHKKPFLVEKVLLPQPTPTPVAGTALIDRLLPPLPPSAAHPASAHLVRADGYLLSLPASVLPPTPVLAPNQILSYRGILQPDGAVEVSSATLITPTLTPEEDKLRDRTTYDQEVMAAAASSTPQSRLSRYFHGIDLDRLPVVEDPALQARVDRIGQSLIPPAARSLSPKDPLFLTFHFRVVDTPKGLHGVIPLPSGTVLLPADAITRLQTGSPTPAQLDSRIAIALAFGIADIREEHLLHAIELAQNLGAANWAGAAASLFIPGVSLATAIATTSVQQHATHLREQQDTRIALALVHDAGYDFEQASLASALLDAPSPKPLDRLKLSPETLDLLSDLGRLYAPTSLSTTLPLPPPPPTPPATPSTPPANPPAPAHPAS